MDVAIVLPPVHDATEMAAGCTLIAVQERYKFRGVLGVLFAYCRDCMMTAAMAREMREAKPERRDFRYFKWPDFRQLSPHGLRAE